MKSIKKYPIYNEGTVVYSQDPHDYYCHICTEEHTTSLEQHLRNESHLHRLQHYTHIFISTRSRIICKLCLKLMHPNQAIEHALSHKWPPWFVTEINPGTLFKNFISQQGDHYFCHLCKVKLPLGASFERHYKDTSHIALKKAKIDEKIFQKLSFTASHYQLAVNNSIFMQSTNSLTCNFCALEIEPSFEAMILHIGVKFHVEKQKKGIKTLKKAKICPLFPEFHTQDKTPERSANRITAECNNNSIYPRRKISPKVFPTPKTTSVKRPQSKKSVTSDKDKRPNGKSKRNIETAAESKPITGRNKKLGNPSRITGTPGEARMTNDRSNILTDKSVLINNSPRHPELPAELRRIRGHNFFCKICRCKVSGYVSVNEHLRGKQHVTNVRLQQNWRTSKFPEGIVRDKNTMILPKIPQSYADKAKLQVKKKLKKRRKLPKHKLSRQKDFRCFVCNERFKYAKDFHIHQTRHFWKRFCKSFHAPSVTVKTPYPGVASLSGRNGDARRIAEGGTELSDEEGNVEFVGNRCIDSPEKTIYPLTRLDIALDDKPNIYEIDKQKIEDIKLGVLLSFVDKDNIYCLVCCKSVTNSLQNFYEHLCSVNHLDYLQRMIEDHNKFKDYPDQLSDLALAQEFMQEMSENVVQCLACEISVVNDSIKLSDHIKSPIHLEKSSLLGANVKDRFNTLCLRLEANFYSTLTYWCVPCMARWSHEIEFRKHLNEKRHKTKVKDFVGQTMIFDTCTTCGALWYGFLKTFHYHSTCKMHRNQKFSSHYRVRNIPYSVERLLRTPERKIEEILRNVESRRFDDKKKEEQLMSNLMRVSEKAYPRVQAYPFGSRVAGLSGPTSDLDIFLDCSTRTHQVYSGKNSSPDQIFVRIRNIKRCLESDIQNWHINRVIGDCRVPIIKTTHRPTGIECDLSFTNGLTVEKTKIIRAYCENSSQCRKLIIFMKNWIGHGELAGHDGISSYGIAWLVIYFLQVKMILPSVLELMKGRKQSRIVAGWETGVNTEFTPCDSGESFSELVLGFFRFYEAFDYRNYVICPLMGRAVEKRDFQQSIRLPHEMTDYLNHLERMDMAESFRIDSIMCLQDPLDLAYNISIAIKKYMVYRFKTLCSLSAQVLDNNR